MDSQVRVASFDAFQDFRAAYAKFAERARNALVAADLEIRRMLDWLEKDQITFWKAEIRRCEEKVNEARGALHRKRITAAFGNTVSDSEEILQWRKAQARLEAAEKMIKVVKQWYQTVQEEVTEYRGPTQQLGNVLDADVPRALASLDRMLDILESYLAVAPPGASDAIAGAFSSAGMAALGGTEVAAPAAATATDPAETPVAEPMIDFQDRPPADTEGMS